MATIRDVAERAGVSIATVSYVLNRRGSVGEDTRLRVLQAVAELGYHANITARNLKRQESRMIGYGWHPMPPDQIHPVLDTFLHSLALEAEENQYHILTFTLPLQPDRLHEPYQELLDIGRVDGFVVSNTDIDDPRIRYLIETGFPFVSFGRANADWRFPWVDVDNELGMYAATRHLLDLDHRRIALLTWPEGSLTGRFREMGYRRAMADAGETIRPEWVLRGEQVEEMARSAARRWLALPSADRPTAIVAISDLLAIGVINEVQDLGLRVPGDLSVVGYDDVPMAQYTRPPLTTVRQPIGQVGKTVVHLLLDILNYGTRNTRGILVPPELIVRRSSSSPSSD